MVCTVSPETPPPPLPLESNSDQTCPAAASGPALQADTQVGKPIIPATGEKVLTQTDYTGQGPHALSLERSFRSGWTGTSRGLVVNPGLGQAWSHNHAVSLVQAGMPNIGSSTAKVLLGDGSVRGFAWDVTSTSFKPTNSADSLVPYLVAGASGWLYKRLDDDSTFAFDAVGKLMTLTQRNGWVNTYSYSSTGQLTQVRNQFGKTLSFAYNAQNQLVSATTSDGQTPTYQYDSAGRLSSVTYPDSRSRTYVYENTTFTLLLTGIIDEAGNRYESLVYDAQGRGISTELAGGANRYAISYASGATGGISAATVTDPLGTQRTYNYAANYGKLAVAGADKPSNTGTGDAASRVQDINGLIIQETDFLGVNTLFTWDINRRLPLNKTQAAGRPEGQSVSTQWHPSFRLPVLVTEAGRSTAYTYDNQGNLLSQTIIDTATGQARTWAWSYITSGSTANLVDTMTDPKGGVWRYTYDSQGNRTTSVNPLSQTTGYSYDAAGRVTSQTEPNGLVSTYAYDARGRLTAQTRGGEASAFSYTAFGQIASATLPNGYQVSYTYDAAQRLIAAQDNRGAVIQYTLDGMGNRTSEVVKDALGNIALATSKTINSLNRVASLQGALGQTTRLDYDANGELASSTDPLSQSTRQTLDALRRPLGTTFADNASASQAWNQLDQLTQVTDPKGVATSYQTNAFGEVVKESSPDIGQVSYQRNANGEVIGMLNAAGNTTTVTRDALGRPLRIQYAPDQIANFSYDSNQAGYLSAMQDKSGSTTYERDPQGRILSKTQSVNDSLSAPAQFQVSYGRNIATGGELNSITYPSGLSVIYRRSAGRITGIDVQAAGRNKPVVPFVSHLAYSALGQPRSWSWSNGDAASRTFDADGRMSANEFASYQFDAASRITGISQKLWLRKVGDVSPSQTPTQTLFTWQAAYDSRNRLSRFAREDNGASSSSTYSFDSNSNRLSAVSTTTSDTDLSGAFDDDDFSQTSSQAQKVDAASNRLLGFTQTLTKTQTSPAGKPPRTVTAQVNYTLDANGAMTSDGLRTFDYDAAQRLSSVRSVKDGFEASVSYLTNALGQRVFKTEPSTPRQDPSADQLGADYTAWLRKNFAWLFNQQNSNNSRLGTAYVYGDAELGQHSLLGEYGNGDAKGKGRTEYIWLPTEDGNSIPVGMYRNGKFFAIHADHLGTPRLITDDDNTPVWQWAYSAFGDNKPTGVLKATHNLKQAITISPVQLRATTPIEMNLRMPGQYFDDESGLFYNYYRNYNSAQGRYTQNDPIGLAGGLNRFLYVEGSPIRYVDPKGLDRTDWSPMPGRSIWNDGPRNGNWGGGNWSGGVSGGGTGKAPPTDSADACYMRHDQCYDAGQSKVSCNADLVRELTSLPMNPKKWPMPPKPGTEPDTMQFLNGALTKFKP